MKIGDWVRVNSNYSYHMCYPYEGEIIGMPGEHSDYYRVAIVPNSGSNPISLFYAEELDLVD
jgi:hypothetical protein